MHVYDFFAKRPGGLSQLTIPQAFKAQGITLKYPARSRSGIRYEDGMVVIAIEKADVCASAEGFRCLLWAPMDQSRDVEADWSIAQERLEHCRMAARHGGADGLLVKQGAVVEANAVLTLQVERRDREYWASWGSVARRHHRAIHVSSAQHSAAAA
jgi:hypothetical protein